MKTWKVTVNINNFTEQKLVFARADSMEEAYFWAKRYYIEKQPDVDFCGVESAVII